MEKQTHILILIFVLFGLTSCKLPPLGFDGGPMCPAMIRLPQIEVQISSSNPLPANVSFVLNGSSVVADECRSEEDEGLSWVQLNSMRTEGEVHLQIYDDPKVAEDFFPSGIRQHPAVDIMNIEIYSRQSCAETPIKVVEIKDVHLRWRLEGTECESVYNAESSIQLE